MMKKYLLMMILFISSFNLFAQDIIMGNQGAVLYTCGTGGVFYDSGGNGSNYSDNESFVLTICPSTAGFGVFVTMTQMDIVAGDSLNIYDGPSTTSGLYPSMPLDEDNTDYGILTQFQASTSNTSGCLTFEFISNGDGQTGNFSFDLSCNAKCQTFYTNVDVSTPDTTFENGDIFYDLCLGDTLELHATNNFPFNNVEYPQSNATCTYEWYWDVNATTPDLGQSQSHYYGQYGGYTGKMISYDDHGCRSYQDYKFKVRVAPIPEFVPFIDSIMCLGTSDTLSGLPQGTLVNGQIVQGDTVFFVPPFYTGDTTFIPDGTSASYTSNAFISGFDNLDTIANCGNVIEVCMSLEHSYSGDLNIVLTCPNGQSINILEYGAGNSPGATNFGEPFADDPVDGLSSDVTPGVAYNYCFSMTNNNFGTLDAEAGNNNYTYTTVPSDINGLTYTYSDDYFPAGTYLPEESLYGLIGCPINGNWSLTFTDNLGLDNGWLFDWQINIDGCMVPDVDSFIMTYDLGYWESDPAITGIVGDSNTIIVSPTSAGLHDFTYVTQDQFGCVYKDTNVIFVDSFDINITPQDTTFCFASNDSVTIQVEGIINSCDYSIEMFDSYIFLDGWNNNTVTILLDGVNSGTFTIPSGSDYLVSTFSVIAGQQIQVQYNAIGSWQTENAFNIIDANGTIIFSDGFDLGGGNGSTAPTSGVSFTTTASCGASNTYVWGPNYNISSLTGESVNVLPNQPTVYYVNATNENGCIATDSSRFNIIAPATSLSPDQTICEGETVQLLATGADTYVWTGSDLDNNNIPNPVSSTTSDITYYVEFATQSCLTTDSVTVFVNTPSIAVINNGINPVSFCNGESIDLFVDNLAGWTYDWQGTANNTNTISVDSAGVYTINYNDGVCDNSSQITVSENPNPILDFSSFTDTILCCTDDELTINIADYLFDNGVVIQSIQWDQELINSNNYQYTYTSNEVGGDGIYVESHIIKLISDNNCESYIYTVPQVITKCANPSFTGPDTIFANTTEVFDLTVNNNDASQSYNWTTTDVSSGAITDATVEDASVNGINDSGETPYEINVSVTNGDCPAEEAEAKTYYVISLTEPLYPDAFTPNGDDLNNLFRPIVNQFAEITEFRIYNRWGDLVYDMSTAENKDGWDGKWKGVDQDIDVYTYYITVKHPDKNIVKEGSFTLLR